eukprot:TRINITY_DN843_c0_g4_i3.p1 TRINITY_DN843_c0_g4~~TRINITY_DN843_c0_g4_i3.p1  ORF type:complete len:689 (+),score=151.77 TRINITY_DN843_c0_g4_i3:46-2112(+)
MPPKTALSIDVAAPSEPPLPGSYASPHRSPHSGALRRTPRSRDQQSRSAPYPSPTAALGARIHELSVHSPHREGRSAAPSNTHPPPIAPSPRAKSKLSRFFSKLKKGIRWPRSKAKSNAKTNANATSQKGNAQANHTDEHNDTDASMTDDESNQHSHLNAPATPTRPSHSHSQVESHPQTQAISLAQSLKEPQRTAIQVSVQPNLADTAPAKLVQVSLQPAQENVTKTVVDAKVNASQDEVAKSDLQKVMNQQPHAFKSPAPLHRSHDSDFNPMPSPATPPFSNTVIPSKAVGSTHIADGESLTPVNQGPAVLQTPPAPSTKKNKMSVESAVHDLPGESQNLLNQMFGHQVVENLHSQSWDQRKEILDTAEATLWEPSKIKEPILLFRASCMLLRILLHDKTQPIVLASLKFLDNLIGTIGDRIGASDLQTDLQPLIPMIVGKSAAVNQRIREVSISTLQSLARNKNLGPFYISPHLVDSLEGKISPVAIQGRCSLVCTLLDEFKTKMQPFEPFIEFANPILEHPDAKARHAGLEVVNKIRGLVSAEQFKRLAMGLPMAIIKTLNIQADGSTSSTAVPTSSSSLPPLRMRTPMQRQDESSFRANKNSVSWAIAESANAESPVASERQSTKGSRERRRERNSGPSTPVDFGLKRKHSANSRPSSKSSTATFASSVFTQDEEEFMNEFMD